MSFLTFFWFFSPKTSKSHAHLIFCYKQKQAQERCVFDEKLPKSKIKYNIAVFFVKLYGTFQRLNPPNSPQTETCKNILKILGNPLLANERLHFFWFFSPKTLRSNAHFIFLCEKNGYENGVFLTKNV